MISTATMSTLKEKEFQMVGCLGKHASYTFYKSIRIGERTLSLSSFFPVRIWPDSAILSIAEVQLLWKDRNESLCSLRLYFLPENTPFGRFSFHGEDELVALQDKVIIRASDLMTWMVEDNDWDWGFLTPSCKFDNENNVLSKAFMSEKIAKEDLLMEFNEPRPNSVVVLNYERYVRLRSVLKRLEGSPDISNWLNHPLVMAIGGLAVGPNCRILFAREVFDCPELEDHELLCNHLAPKLKGRPRKKKRNRSPSVGSVSNESETSSTASSGSAEKGKTKKPLNGLLGPNQDIRIPAIAMKGGRMMGEKDLEGIQKELIFGSSANGLQILKVDSSQMLKNGQISGHSGSGRRGYNQGGPGRRVDGRSGAYGAASSALLEGKHGNADMLGPGLNELAQKLKKSNALQILAIRPQLGAGDYDMFQLKRMKMDPDPDFIFRFNSDIFINPLNSGPYTAKKHTIYAAPMIDKVVSKTHDIVKHMVGSNHAQKSSTNLQITPHEKPPKQPVVTASIDQGAAIITPTPLHNDSSFRPKNQIYSNPAADRIPVPESFSRHSGKESVVDLSIRKRRYPQGESSHRSIPSASASTRVTRESDLLDLSVKPSSSGGRQHVYGRPEIPPPIVMDKLGLQLTSEVTLFPSPSYMGKVKESGHSRSSHKGAATVVSNPGNQMKHPESIPGSSRKSLRSPSTSSVVHGGASSMAGMGAASSKEASMRHHPQNHYPNHLSTKPVFGAPDRGIIPGLSSSQGHSASSAITIKPMTNEEKQSAAKLKELEKAYQQAMPAPQFLPHSSFVPKMDPTYLSLLANPFLMSPLMSLPNAMEQFQMYKDLFQQSGIPQFPMHWPQQGPGNDRNSK